MVMSSIEPLNSYDAGASISPPITTAGATLSALFELSLRKACEEVISMTYFLGSMLVVTVCSVPLR